MPFNGVRYNELPFFRGRKVSLLTHLFIQQSLCCALTIAWLDMEVTPTGNTSPIFEGYTKAGGCKHAQVNAMRDGGEYVYLVQMRQL